MYTPPPFLEEDPEAIRGMIRSVPLATLVTFTGEGLKATPLPLCLEARDDGNDVLHGHVARANPQWRLDPVGEAMAVFQGPDAYVSPSWYPSKQRHGQVVPTWNYVAVHAYGPLEVFEDEDRLREVVTRLTQAHEAPRATPWAVTDAPEPFVAAQLRGIVGVRLPITRVEAKVKLSQNRDDADQEGVAAALRRSDREGARAIGQLMTRARRQAGVADRQ